MQTALEQWIGKLARRGRACLSALYQEHEGAPEVRTKKRLWARLLQTALGTQFEESDELFIAHTLLVSSAEIIARVVAGMDVTTMSPLSLLSRSKLEESDLFGSAEADCFDWIVLVPRGDAFVRVLARRLARFDWSAVEHDVLKVLYEAIIGAKTRKKLGEYYTPDWLAEKVVEEVVTDPLHQRVLDPACGSGTFLFHAVRRYLAAAEAQEMPIAAMLDGAVSYVFGMDLHPVAVRLARVTYLLAIGKKRLQHAHGALRIPVFLGDSMQWEEEGKMAREARREHRVDVLVGNPPWLSYRFMPDTRKPSTGNKGMQERFREMSKARRLWTGTSVAPQQDLSGLFVARMIQLYLTMAGRFGFVMPNAVVDRDYFAGFRSGNFDEPEGEVRVTFTTPWDLRRLRPHFFPRGSAVILGQRTTQAGGMPAQSEVWTGRLPEGNPPWSAVKAIIERNLGEASAAPSTSPYTRRFVDGATIYPRLLFMVKKEKAGPLGQASGKRAVRSARSANEKKPWAGLPDLRGVVETELLRPVYLGESILPYRALEPALAVIPRDMKFLLEPGKDRIDHYPELARWVRLAEEMWIQHRSTARLSLIEQLNYHNKLESQFPMQPQRVVYSKSGMHLAAARIDNRRAVVDHTLYWATTTSAFEAHYLCGILNAAVVTQLVRPLMSYGKDERHIDKHIWRLPIPAFDEETAAHTALAALGKEAEEAIAKLPLATEKHFAASRRTVRAFLAESDIGQEIERQVTALLS